MNSDDAFSCLVKTLLKRTVGEPPAVQSKIMQSMTRLYQAVPSWMLTFGAAHNSGCSALVGLETFKVTTLLHSLVVPIHSHPLGLLVILAVLSVYAGLLQKSDAVGTQPS